VAAGFILWKRAKGQERINRSRKCGRGGNPRRTSKPKKRFQRAERAAKTHEGLLGFLIIL
jgi:hypothetical protein